MSCILFSSAVEFKNPGLPGVVTSCASTAMAVKDITRSTKRTLKSPFVVFIELASVMINGLIVQW